MLQLSYIREHTEEVKAGLQKKNFKQIDCIDEILLLDEQRRNTQKLLDDNLAKVNFLAKEIGSMYKLGKQADAESAKAEAAQLKEKAKELEILRSELEVKLNEKLVIVPNLPHASVPKGHGADDNEVVETHGNIDDFDKGLLPHWELTGTFNLIDFELGSKIAGSGFPVYMGKMARLQRALIQFFLDRAGEAGYFEIQPPYLINDESGYGTGQLPDKDGQMYHMPIDQLYLIPTAEVPVTNIFRDVIVKEQDIPYRLTAYSACFRREAGSYGKDVRGLNRLHQFDKVEIVRIEKPDASYSALDEMCKHVGSLIAALGLPYRVLRLCGGDMSFTSALTYDFEVWAAGQKRWLEVSSVSNFETFQSNRMKLRYKDASGRMVLPHTLNGSALAIPRIAAAIIENFQTSDGIRIPEVLHQYTGFDIMSNDKLI